MWNRVQEMKPLRYGEIMKIKGILNLFSKRVVFFFMFYKAWIPWRLKLSFCFFVFFVCPILKIDTTIDDTGLYIELSF